jgi:hypothetical protein
MGQLVVVPTNSATLYVLVYPLPSSPRKPILKSSLQGNQPIIEPLGVEANKSGQLHAFHQIHDLNGWDSLQLMHQTIIEPLGVEANKSS